MTQCKTRAPRAIATIQISRTMIQNTKGALPALIKHSCQQDTRKTKVPCFHSYKEARPRISVVKGTHLSALRHEAQ